MIVSASRRTDIPAFYSDWFMNRLAEGYALVRNPVNPHQVSRVSLSPDVVDCIVFWTKNPAPMLDRLDRLKGRPYYFQFTLNAYGEEVEPGLPPKDALISTFKALADRIGKERVIWRYDPILISPKYGVDYHADRFGELAQSLKDHTEKCTISFIDIYKKIGGCVRELGIQEISDEQKRRIAGSLAKIAASYGLGMDACAEGVAFDGLSINPARCVDDRLISLITGYPIPFEKDKNQRPACGCAASVDIGAYDTCPHGCRYCYANRPGTASVARLYDPASPLLCSVLDPADIVRDRPARLLRRDQLSFL